MNASTLDEQLHKYLSDAHSIEEQALVQLRRAPEIAGDPELAALFSEHLTETESHERIVRERLEAHGAGPSAVKGTVMKAGGVGFVLFAQLQPDTPGKLVTHAFSYEALEQGSYELLLRVAERAGDIGTVEAARRIRDEERAMASRLEGAFERAAQASLDAVGRDDLGEQVRKYLADAHALAGQSIQLLERGPKIGGEPELERLCADHLEETRRQRALLEERLGALGGSPSAIKDAAMRLGALNWGVFFQAQPDTPGKLAAFIFAVEHLGIGGYEQLRTVARQAGDHQTATTVEGILAEERNMAERVTRAFDGAVLASLEAQGVTP